MTFIAWLQGRLVAHGARIAVDGDWGRNSILALTTFQLARGLPATGVADQKTVAALKQSPSGKGPVTPIPMAAAVTAMPPWMAEMHRKMGLHEVSDTASLIAWLKIGKYLGNPKNLPWCGDAMESAIAKDRKSVV